MFLKGLHFFKYVTLCVILIYIYLNINYLNLKKAKKHQ